MMSTSGLDENGNTYNTSEIYTLGQGWGTEIPGNPSGLNDPSFTFAFPLYPRMHLLPSGQVFYSAPSSATLVFDPSHQAWSFLAWTIYGGAVEERTYGSSVLLPLTPANNYDPKVIIMGGDNPATNTTSPRSGSKARRWRKLAWKWKPRFCLMVKCLSPAALQQMKMRPQQACKRSFTIPRRIVSLQPEPILFPGSTTMSSCSCQTVRFLGRAGTHNRASTRNISRFISQRICLTRMAVRRGGRRSAVLPPQSRMGAHSRCRHRIQTSRLLS